MRDFDLSTSNANAVWLALLLVLGCASPGSPGGADTAPAADPNAEEVALAFAWPDDFAAEVEARMVTDRGKTMDYAFELRAERGGDRLWLRHRAFRMKSPKTGQLVPLAPESQEAKLIAGIEPDFAVDREGSLAEIDDEAVAAMVDDLIVHAAEGEAPPEQVRELARRVAVARQARRAQEVWGALVESWVGASVGLDSRYEGLEMQRSPQDRPGSEMDFVGELEVGGWIPCPGATGERRCVELSMASRLAEQDPQRLMRELGLDLRELGLDKLEPDAVDLIEGRHAADLVVEYREEESIRLVCEPGRLIPHELDHRSARLLAMDVPGRGIERLDRVRETRYRFRYAD
jgi:hypothetical protein